MNREQQKAAWAEKITSREQFRELINRGAWPDVCSNGVGECSVPMSQETGVVFCAADSWSDVDNRWWLQREVAREVLGIYPQPTQVLLALRGQYAGFGQYFPHISKDDPSMVAYTPDRQCGEADRQVRTTIGKFLRKFLLVVSDKEIARLEQMHRAEMDPTFELATDQDTIEHVYTTMVGDTGCMRYSKSRFGFREYHPSAVYAGVPGLGVAFIRDGNGAVTARSVVYVNPEDENDKRYVRVFGAAVLKTKLERSGYRLAGLEGVKLPKLRDPAFDDYQFRFVMPYLDAPGGPHVRGEDKAGTYVINPKGENHLLVINSTLAVKYSNVKLPVTSAQSTTAIIQVREIDLSSLEFTCPLTGVSVNRLVHQTAWYLASAGSEPVEIFADSSITRSLAVKYFYPPGGDTRAYVFLANGIEPEGVTIPGHSSYLNTEATRAGLGVVQLDAGLYPDDREYKSEDGVVTDNKGRVVRKADVVSVVDSNWTAGHTLTAVHISDAPTLKADGYVPVPNVNGRRTYCHKDNPNLVVTNGGRKAVKGLHDVAANLLGGYDRATRLTRVRLLVSSASIRKDLTMEQAVAGTIREEFMNERAEYILAQGGQPRDLTNVLKYGIDGLAALYMPEGTDCPAYRYAHITVDAKDIIRAADWVLANPTLVAGSVGHPAYYTLWAKTVKSVVAKVIELCPDIRRELAPDALVQETPEENTPTPDAIAAMAA